MLRFRSSFLRSSSEAVGLRGALRFLSMEARHSGGLCDLAIRSGVSTENTCFLKEPSSTNTMCEGRILSGPVLPCVVNSTCYTCQREGGVGHHHAEERPKHKLACYFVSRALAVVGPVLAGLGWIVLD